MKNFMWTIALCIFGLLTPWRASAQLSRPSNYTSLRQAYKPMESSNEADSLLGAPSEQPDYAGNPTDPTTLPAKQPADSLPGHTYGGQARSFASGNRPTTNIDLGEVDPYSNLSISGDGGDEASNNTDVASKRMAYSKLSLDQNTAEINGSQSKHKEVTTIYKNPW